MRKRQVKKNSWKLDAIATMTPPQRPSLLPPGIDWVDLGDMAEMREFDIARLGYRVRWDCMVNGNHRVTGSNRRFRRMDGPKLRKCRNKVRNAFMKDSLRKT
jgi:hypothetical protein